MQVRCDVVVPFAPVVVPNCDVDLFVLAVVVVVVVDVFAYVVNPNWVVSASWTVGRCDL